MNAGLCQCGHALDFCHIRNAEKWCGWHRSGEHLCYVSDDGDDGTNGHYRPCPAGLCEASLLYEMADHLRHELAARRACLVGARDDLERIAKAGVQDGGLWIRAVAEARLPLIDAAIAETDRHLTASAAVSRHTQPGTPQGLEARSAKTAETRGGES